MFKAALAVLLHVAVYKADTLFPLGTTVGAIGMAVGLFGPAILLCSAAEDAFFPVARE